MADDPKPTPTAPIPEPAPQLHTPQPTPTAPEPPAPVPDSVKKQAAYFARKPDEFEAVLTELGKATSTEANQRVDMLQRELTVRDALSDNGLTRADAAFIRGNTAAEINASAAALKARIGNGTAPPADPNAPAPEATVPTAPASPPPLPEHRGGTSSVEQAEQDLRESFAATDWSPFTSGRPT